MKAAWYDSPGPAATVLHVGDLPAPGAGPGEVRINIRASGINPGDVKKRSDEFGIGMPYPRVIPHSDGAGLVESVGEGVTGLHVGDRVWCFGAQSYRAFGTAAELCVVPSENVVPLPDGISFAQGACLGIPGITAHRAVHAGGPPRDRTVVIQGGAGSVGIAAVALARFAGARVLATVRSEAQAAIAAAAGAHDVIRTDGVGTETVVARFEELAPGGVDHIVEVAFDANVVADEQILRKGGSIAAYATGDPQPAIPFWPLVFKNIRLFFLGSDDFTPSQKREAAADLSAALVGGWPGYSIGQAFAIEDVAQAHEAVENRAVEGRVVIELPGGGP